MLISIPRPGFTNEFLFLISTYIGSNINCPTSKIEIWHKNPSLEFLDEIPELINISGNLESKNTDASVFYEYLKKPNSSIIARNINYKSFSDFKINVQNEKFELEKNNLKNQSNQYILNIIKLISGNYYSYFQDDIHNSLNRYKCQISETSIIYKAYEHLYTCRIPEDLTYNEHFKELKLEFIEPISKHNFTLKICTSFIETGFELLYCSTSSTHRINYPSPSAALLVLFKTDSNFNELSERHYTSLDEIENKDEISKLMFKHFILGRQKSFTYESSINLTIEDFKRRTENEKVIKINSELDNIHNSMSEFNLSILNSMIGFYTRYRLNLIDEPGSIDASSYEIYKDVNNQYWVKQFSNKWDYQQSKFNVV